MDLVFKETSLLRGFKSFIEFEFVGFWMILKFALSKKMNFGLETI